jgi:uncharacterized protein (DUF58 family)
MKLPGAFDLGELIDRLDPRRYATGNLTNANLLGTRSVYILPTGHGLLFALVLMALLVGAMNYSNALAYLLTFLLASLAVVSLLHTQRNLLHLRVTILAGEPVFVGESATFRVCVQNDHAQRPALRVEAKDQTPLMFDVPAHDTHCAALSVASRTRGWLPCPATVLATTYPLGITRAWSRRLLAAARVLVYPRPAEQSVMWAMAGIEGETGPGAVRQGDDFSGLRPYQPGDALARISWKTFARGQGLHTKEFSVPEAETLWLEWETLAPLEVEARLSILTRALLDAEENGQAYGLRLPGVTLQPDQGPEQRRRGLEALALYGAAD